MRQLSRLRWLRRLWQVRWLSLVRQLRLWLVAIAGPKFVKIVVGPDAGRDDTRRGQIRLVAISAGDRLKAGVSDVGKAPRGLVVGRLLDTIGKRSRRVSPAQHYRAASCKPPIELQAASPLRMWNRCSHSRVGLAFRSSSLHGRPHAGETGSVSAGR